MYGAERGRVSKELGRALVAETRKELPRFRRVVQGLDSDQVLFRKMLFWDGGS